MVQPDAVTTDLREHFVQVPNVACSSRSVTIPPRLSRPLSKDSCQDARTFPREPIELADSGGWRPWHPGVFGGISSSRIRYRQIITQCDPRDIA